MNDITVKILTTQDIPAVKVLDDLSGNDVEQWLDDDNIDFAWGIFLNHNLIGYCTTGYADDCPAVIENHPLHTADSILLSDVFILPQHRHHGYATQLIKTALELRHTSDGYDETVFLAVLYDDLAALYEPLGFSFIDDNGRMILPKQKAGDLHD